ncbi:hypothetical protein ACFWPQ_01770 [Streptomyces sp. NPDC058464]|uniref:hypothetical protein n=1 Tax=Streptomyces sp. NPDC058464 TaxID=3346511 RepID=UPI00364BE78F
MGDVTQAHRAVQEELIRLAAPLADEVRDKLDAAVARGDAEAVRREGHDWSGWIGRSILHLADEVEAASSNAEED